MEQLIDLLDCDDEYKPPRPGVVTGGTVRGAAVDPDKKIKVKHILLRYLYFW